MKPWLKKITSVVSVAALSSSMIAANLTVAVAEEGNLGDIDGDPIVSITHLSAKAQEDAMKAEEESLNTITGGETVTVIIELETPGVIEAGYTPGTAEAAAYANGLKADQAAMNAQIESLGAQTVEIENKINGTAEPAPVFEVRHGDFIVIFKNNIWRTESKGSAENIAAALLEFCNTPRTRAELEQFTGFTRYYIMKEIVSPLIESWQLAMTIPDKPKSKNQKYYAIK